MGVPFCQGNNISIKLIHGIRKFGASILSMLFQFGRIDFVANAINFFSVPTIRQNKF